jgi:hypothetical protein
MTRKFYSDSELAKVTIMFDTHLVLGLQKLTMVLRHKGYSRMSRGWLISAFTDASLRLFEEKGVDWIDAFLKEQLESFNGLEPHEEDIADEQGTLEVPEELPIVDRQPTRRFVRKKP